MGTPSGAVTGAALESDKVYRDGANAALVKRYGSGAVHGKLQALVVSDEA